ncbi:hypothetical protein PoB_006045000 [Plakobranchus ocellatus]|uniref:Uncharacterized protein n=1 Tax=Plakobranchus ocellatus TaxID=259542 RepID=A0AAV4CPW7_9GAST|nr:hypothetical protein PoB_006045000 [Plakobranchus ocellatus]
MIKFCHPLVEAQPQLRVPGGNDGRAGRIPYGCGDLRLSGSPSGHDAGRSARTRDRRVPAELRADSLASLPPTPRAKKKEKERLKSGEKKQIQKLFQPVQTMFNH